MTWVLFLNLEKLCSLVVLLGISVLLIWFPIGSARVDILLVDMCLVVSAVVM